MLPPYRHPLPGSWDIAVTRRRSSQTAGTLAGHPEMTVWSRKPPSQTTGRLVGRRSDKLAFKF